MLGRDPVYIALWSVSWLIYCKCYWYFCVEGVCEFSAVIAELDNLSVIIVGFYRPPPADDLRIYMSVISPCKLASTCWIWKIGLQIVKSDFNWIYPLRVPSNVSRPWLHLSLNQQTPTFSPWCEINNILRIYTTNLVFNKQQKDPLWSRWIASPCTHYWTCISVLFSGKLQMSSLRGIVPRNPYFWPWFTPNTVNLWAIISCKCIVR